MDYPKISIVTPVFNQVEYLEETVQSVLSQGYPNLEYIIIDGGSTDGTVDIIKKYESQLAYWVSEPDDGLYFAIKKGFDRTTGEIMAWIGSDDIYHPNSFFTVAQIFSECPQVSWLIGPQTHYDEKNRTVDVRNSPYFNHLSFLMHQYQWVQQESTFWRRSLYKKVGGIQTKYKLAGDFDLWMRFSRHERMYITNALIGGFRHRKSQLSKNLKLYYSEADNIIANELISDKERNQINIMKRNSLAIAILKKFKVINWHSVYNRFANQYVEEERRQRIYFDFDKQKFIIPQ